MSRPRLWPGQAVVWRPGGSDHDTGRPAEIIDIRPDGDVAIIVAEDREHVVVPWAHVQALESTSREQ